MFYEFRIDKAQLDSIFDCFMLQPKIPFSALKPSYITLLNKRVLG